MHGFFAYILALVPLMGSPQDKEAPPDRPQATSRLPWKTGVSHRYVWVEGSEKVGETTFTILENVEEGSYEIRTSRRYAKSPTSMEAHSVTVVKSDGSPARFEESLEVAAVKGFRGRMETTITVSDGKARARYVPNGKEERAATSEHELQPGTYLCASQAVEHWAVFCSKIGKGEREVTLRILYPDFQRVYELRFEAKGRETLRVAGVPTETDVYGFSEPSGQLSGKIWLDDTRRLVQIEFPARSPEAKPLRVVLTSKD